MRKVIVAVAVLVVVQGLILLIYLGVERNRGAEPLDFERPGTPAPDLSLQSSEGSELRLSELRGSTTVLHFWATWCPPCLEELPSLLDYGSTTTDVELLAVSVDSDWDAVRSFVGNSSLERVYLASSDAVADAYRVDELPQTLVIDSTGRLCLHFRSAQDWDSSKVRELVAECGK